MERTRLTGALLMAGAVVQLLAFVLGARRRRWTALGVPVALSRTAASLLAFWIGWNLLAQEDDLEGLEYGVEPLEHG